MDNCNSIDAFVCCGCVMCNVYVVDVNVWMYKLQVPLNIYYGYKIRVPLFTVRAYRDFILAPQQNKTRKWSVVKRG